MDTAAEIARIHRRFILVNVESGCWLWTGYGKIMRGGWSQLAHRYVRELYEGPHDDGLELDHLCRVPPCVRPDHLEPVPRLLNVLRGESPAARAAAQTHCVHGHPFDAANTYIRIRDGRHVRNCRTCGRKATSRYLMRKALAREVGP